MFFVTKRMESVRSCYVGDSETDSEERFGIDDVLLMVTYGVEIAGVVPTKTGGWSIRTATPPSADNARATLIGMPTYSVIKGELKTAKYTRGEGPFKIVIGDIATSVGALAFSYELCRKGMRIFIDDRVKKVHKRWIGEAISLNDIKVDISAVTSDSFRSKLYASTPISFIIDTHPDAVKYRAEAIVNGGCTLGGDPLLADPDIHEFYLRRNKTQLKKELTGMRRENNNAEGKHNITAVEEWAVTTWITWLEQGVFKQDQRVINLIDKLRFFVKLQDQRIRSYYALGGRDKELIDEYHDIMLEYMKDIKLAKKVGTLGLDTTERMPYHDYMALIQNVSDAMNSGMTFSAIMMSFKLRKLDKRYDMHR